MCVRESLHEVLCEIWLSLLGGGVLLALMYIGLRANEQAGAVFMLGAGSRPPESCALACQEVLTWQVFASLIFLALAPHFLFFLPIRLDRLREAPSFEHREKLFSMMFSLPFNMYIHIL